MDSSRQRNSTRATGAPVHRSLDPSGRRRARRHDTQALAFVGSEEQVTKLRKRLEEVFGNVSLAHDVVAICIELSEGNTGDFNPEMAHVLRRCVAEKLHFQLEVLTSVIERLGGTTAFSNADAVTPGRAIA
jgi:hypothetical protein